VSWTGNCLHFRWMVKSSPWIGGKSVILGMNAFSPSWSPPNRWTWRTRFDICTTVALLLLHNPCLWSKLWSRMMGHLSFNSKWASGNPKEFRELRNSTSIKLGECCVPASITYVLALLYVCGWSGKRLRICMFSLRTLSLRGARRTLS